jgi:hypothetical protein
VPAMAAFKEQGWAAHAITPAAKLRVEVSVPAVVHEVPVAAVERWLPNSSASPKEAQMKTPKRIFGVKTYISGFGTSLPSLNW